MAAITIGDISREHRRSFPDRLAVIDGKGRQTWPDFDDRTNQVANLLIGLDIGAGDRVLWLAQSSASFLELLIGCAKVGAMVCPVNWRQSSDELRFVIEDFSPRLVVWQDEEIGEAVATGTCQHVARRDLAAGGRRGRGQPRARGGRRQCGRRRRRGIRRRTPPHHLHGRDDRPPQRVDADPPQPARHGHGHREDHRGRPRERLPQLGSAVPRRELPVRGGSRVPARRHQHLRPARRRIRGAADHRGRTCDVGLPDAADHRRDQGAEPRGATGPLEPASPGRSPPCGGTRCRRTRLCGAPSRAASARPRSRDSPSSTGTADAGSATPEDPPRWSRCEWWTPKGRSARSGRRARSSSGATSCTPATGTVPSSTAGGCGTDGGTPPTSAVGSPTGPSTSSAR